MTKDNWPPQKTAKELVEMKKAGKIYGLKEINNPEKKEQKTEENILEKKIRNEIKKAEENDNEVGVLDAEKRLREFEKNSKSTENIVENNSQEKEVKEKNNIEVVIEDKKEKKEILVQPIQEGGIRDVKERLKNANERFNELKSKIENKGFFSRFLSKFDSTKSDNIELKKLQQEREALARERTQLIAERLQNSLNDGDKRLDVAKKLSDRTEKDSEKMIGAGGEILNLGKEVYKNTFGRLTKKQRLVVSVAIGSTIGAVTGGAAGALGYGARFIAGLTGGAIAGGVIEKIYGQKGLEELKEQNKNGQLDFSKDNSLFDLVKKVNIENEEEKKSENMRQFTKVAGAGLVAFLTGRATSEAFIENLDLANSEILEDKLRELNKIDQIKENTNSLYSNTDTIENPTETFQNSSINVEKGQGAINTFNKLLTEIKTNNGEELPENLKGMSGEKMAQKYNFWNSENAEESALIYENDKFSFNEKGEITFERDGEIVVLDDFDKETVDKDFEGKFLDTDKKEITIFNGDESSNISSIFQGDESQNFNNTPIFNGDESDLENISNKYLNGDYEKLSNADIKKQQLLEESLKLNNKDREYNPNTDLLLNGDKYNVQEGDNINTLDDEKFRIEFLEASNNFKNSGDLIEGVNWKTIGKNINMGEINYSEDENFQRITFNSLIGNVFQITQTASGDITLSKIISGEVQNHVAESKIDNLNFNIKDRGWFGGNIINEKLNDMLIYISDNLK